MKIINSKFVTSEISACRKTLKLWEELQERQTYEKTAISIMLFKEKYINFCPCCEFSKNKNKKYNVDCSICPLSDFWLTNNSESDKMFRCEQKGSSYLLFSDCNNNDEMIEGIDGVVVAAMKALDYWKSLKEMNINY